MIIEERRERSAIVLSPIGRLDSAAGGMLETRIAEIAGRGEALVVLECSRAVLVSGGLRALLTCARLCRREGGELIVAALKSRCRAMLRVSGMLTVLDHYETSAAALARPNRTGRGERRRGGSKSAQAALEIEERTSGPALVVSVVGRLNDVGASRLERRLLQVFERDKRLLVLDCAELNYINSAGLRALHLCVKACRHRVVRQFEIWPVATRPDILYAYREAWEGSCPRDHKARSARAMSSRTPSRSCGSRLARKKKNSRTTAKTLLPRR